MFEIGSYEFWVGLAKIIGVNIVLSGDNAVVIALAARSQVRKIPAAARSMAPGTQVIQAKIVNWRTRRGPTAS